MDTSAEDPETVKTSLMQSLISSVPNLMGSSARSAAMSILIPCLLMRATHAVPNGSKEDLAKESSARLLELAGADGVAFRGVVGSLDGEQREKLETLLRSAGVGRQQGAKTHRRTDTGTSLPDEEEESKPAIALRMDF